VRLRGRYLGTVAGVEGPGRRGATGATRQRVRAHGRARHDARRRPLYSRLPLFDCNYLQKFELKCNAV
jgi:hypothetical protein